MSYATWLELRLCAITAFAELNGTKSGRGGRHVVGGTLCPKLSSYYRIAAEIGEIRRLKRLEPAFELNWEGRCVLGYDVLTGAVPSTV